MIDFLISFLIFLSGLFILLSALGLKRFPDLYCRLHASSMASSGAKICSMGAACLYFWNSHFGVSIKFICSLIFILTTAPLAAHLIARAGYKRGIKPCDQTARDDYSKVTTF